MRTKTLIAVLFCLLLPVMAAASEFSSVIEDLPLMPGMREITDSAVVFDKPGGRILETSVNTDATAADVGAFYSSALPPLGWQRTGTRAYVRAGEKLTITAEPQTHTVQFKITPLTQGE